MTEADRKALADRIDAPRLHSGDTYEIRTADARAAADYIRTAPGYRAGLEAAAKVCEERAAMPPADGQVGYGAKVAEALAARILSLMPPAAEEMAETPAGLALAGFVQWCSDERSKALARGDTAEEYGLRRAEYEAQRRREAMRSDRP